MIQLLVDKCPLCKHLLEALGGGVYDCLNCNGFITVYKDDICIYAELKIADNKFCCFHFNYNYMQFRNKYYEYMEGHFPIPKIDWLISSNKIIDKIKLLLTFM